MKMSNTLNNQTVEWKNLNWRKLERVTFKLQKRIFQASERGDVKAVRKLQKTLIRSWSAKCIAVRRVTQDNQGKNTAGIDGVKSLSPKQRTTLVNSLKLTGKSKPTRRVMIPKPGSEEKRPLGIPTIDDRALQALVKIALEPEWEALFEPNSYGFRPGRSCHDAIGAIYLSIKQKAKYVLDADIAKCFDRIDHNGNVGFEFLGFHIQQHKVGNYRCAKNPHGALLGFKTLITPSKPKIKAHLAKIAEVIDTHKTAPQAALISKLNPIIRGWSNYYSTVVSKETFSKCDNLTYDKLRAWARKRGKGSINKDKYWRTVGNQNWCFSTEDGLELMNHAATPIIRHVKVKGEASPYNGDWIYWGKRRGEYPETPTRVSKLLKVQKGICTHCGLYFTSTDVVEVDHITPKSLSGKDEYKNLQLLHRHCHDTKTALDGSLHKNYDEQPF